MVMGRGAGSPGSSRGPERSPKRLARVKILPGRQGASDPARANVSVHLATGQLAATASGRIYSSSKRRTNGKRVAATFFCSSVRRSLSVLAELREPSALAVGFRGQLAEQPYLGHSPIARNRFLCDFQHLGRFFHAEAA